MKRAAALMGLLAACAAAEDLSPPALPDPVLYDAMFAQYDLASVKEGQWIRYEVRVEVPGAAMPQTCYTLACVGGDEKTVLLETDQFNAGREGCVTLARVVRASNKVIEAWFGKRGETARPVKVAPAPEPGGGAKVPAVEMTGRASLKQDSLRVKGAPFGCELVTYDITVKLNGMEFRSATKTWTSNDMYFRYKPLDASQPSNVTLKLEWEDDRKPEGKGGLVRTETETNGMKTVMELAGWGDNAGRSVRLPDDPADFVPAAAPGGEKGEAKPAEKPAPKDEHE